MAKKFFDPDYGFETALEKGAFIGGNLLLEKTDGQHVWLSLKGKSEGDKVVIAKLHTALKDDLKLVQTVCGCAAGECLDEGIEDLQKIHPEYDWETIKNIAKEFSDKFAES